MSVSQPEADREYEELKRAQRSHEASMDEILASIRAIIADDKSPAPASPPRAAPAPAATPVPQVIYSNFGQPKSAEASTQPAAKEPAPQPVIPTVVWSRPDEEAFEAGSPAAAEPAEAERLVSPEADRAVTASFQTLAASAAMPSAERMEELARETLRPMMKAWLDENLPSLVERLVSVEIQRLARGGR